MEPKSPDTTKHRSNPKRRRLRFWRATLIALLSISILLGIGRAVLPNFVRDYVNKTLDKNLLYDGRIGEVRILLWRGAYSISDVRIMKMSGHVPVPLFAAKRVDFAMQWDAIMHGKLVGKIYMLEPELNFVDALSGGEDQTGVGGPWLQMISDLFPFRINRAVIQDGSVHFRVFQSEKPVDVYVSDVNASIDNLGNIRDETKPLVSTVRATGMVMDQAKLEFNMTLDPFSYRPTFKLALRLLGLDVTRINDLARTYGKFDFEHGWFDLVVEAEAQEGQLKGYAKPLFRHLQVFSLMKDIKDENALEVFWQSLVGGVAALLTNRARDQFGTLIPFTGDLSGATTTDILATMGNIFKNAFIRAYLPRLEGGEPGGALKFDPPELSDPVSVGDE